MVLYSEHQLAHSSKPCINIPEDNDTITRQVTFEALQVFCGEMEMNWGPYIELRAEKTNNDGKTQLNWEIWAGPSCGNVKMILCVPAHYFWRLIRSKDEELKIYPLLFTFQLAHEGHKHLQENYTEIYTSVKKHHESRNKEYPELIFVVLNPSVLRWYEDGEEVYNVWYSSAVEKFHEEFDEHWFKHMQTHMDRFPDPRMAHAPMEEFAAEDLMHLTKRFGFRNYDTGEGYVRTVTNRKFLPRKEGKTKKMHHMTAKAIKAMEVEIEKPLMDIEMEDSKVALKQTEGNIEKKMEQDERRDGHVFKIPAIPINEPRPSEKFIKPVEEQRKSSDATEQKPPGSQDNLDDEETEDDGKDVSPDGVIVYPENLNDFFRHMRAKKNQKNRLLKELEDRVVKERPARKKKVDHVAVEENILPEGDEADAKDTTDAKPTLTERDPFDQFAIPHHWNMLGSLQSDSSCQPSTSGLQPDHRGRPKRQRQEPAQVYKPEKIKFRPTKRR
ncbi:hypothetical protein L3Y34_010311 [Caenorhabditis briggsae]|uniref:Uncharacterized protein n=1 Tax=Caenorhabditis briggsae TaxID=6238 RepID=A0AAE9CSI4_CAEBR|nr:hypothetical protein L3Y34_010311 [Caenorhabditis briggsae]